MVTKVGLEIRQTRQTAAELAAGVTPVNEWLEPRNVLRYGTNTTPGTTDMTAAIQAAVNVAIQDNNGAAYIPAGDYVVSSTITCGKVKIFGDGVGSRLIPTISDDSPVLNFPIDTNFFSLEDFYIVPVVTDPPTAFTTDFVSGAGDGQACTGIRLTSVDPDFSTRFHMKNFRVLGLKVGYDIQGFIGSIENLWASYCETALIGDTMNSVRINARFENNRKDFAITDSNGIHFDQYISEGFPHASGVVSSTIDGCKAVTFNSPYFEHVRNSPFIVFGGTSECKSITINSLLMSMGNNAASDYEVYPLAFDKVNGLEISGYYSVGWHANFYSVTTNTKNIIDKSINIDNANFGPHDLSLNLSRVLNHFPNPNFDMWFRGWPSVIVTNGTASQETTLVRRGDNAVKLLFDAAQTSSILSWLFNDSYLGLKLAGKTVSLYMWIWIPNTADFDPNLEAARLTKPAITITTDGTGGTTTSSSGIANQRNTWNLFKVSAAVPADATYIDVRARMDRASASAGTEYIVVDSVFLIEGDLGQDLAIRNGWISESDINPCKSVRGMMRVGGAAAPTDVDQAYGIGDIVWDDTPSAGGTAGWICTTAGAGGTAVFKTFGAITA